MAKKTSRGVAAASRAATMADVARLAEVSVPTVSRVLTGAAQVSPVKRERVLAAIEELSFRPSAAARALATRRSDVIAIVTGSTSQYGYAETIRGIEEAARAEGLSVLITVAETADEVEVDKAVATALSQPIAGVVVLKFDPPGVAALARFPDDVPVVAISGVRDVGVPQAVLDETRAADELVSHLLGLGHPTVHHVRVPPSRREDGRTTGWRRALRRAGAAIPDVFDATWSPLSGYDVGRRIASDPEVTAVFCGNDEIAMGVIRGLADSGVTVPTDVSVVGFDDHPLARLWMPSLTTVDQDFADLGRRGVAILLSVIAGDDGPRYSSIRPPLVLRESSGGPSGARLAAAAARTTQPDGETAQRPA